MTFPSISKFVIAFLVIFGILSTKVYAKIEVENEGEGLENLNIDNEPTKESQPQVEKSSEANNKKFDEIFEDPEIQELLRNENFDINDLFEILKKKGIDLPSSPPTGNEYDESSIYRHSDLPGEGSEENSSDILEKSEI